jgi:hypothetical protein
MKWNICSPWQKKRKENESAKRTERAAVLSGQT